MKFFVKTSNSGNWPEIKNFFVKTSETNPIWSNIKKAWVKVSSTDPGSWKMFWYKVIPKIQSEVTIVATTDATTKAITLTGTNYHWTDADTLTYKIQKSIDDGATWPTTLKSGTATNPNSGASNTYTYVLLDNKLDVTPNLQNRYRFVVTATNTDSGGINESFADNEYVSGPEDVTIVEDSKTYYSVSISWNAAQHANKYLVYYKTSESSTFIYSKVISNTSTTIDGLLTYISYDFKVIPITGVSLTNIGYRGNDSNILTVVTDVAPAPVQLTAPTISGSGYAFTSINGTAGTYQSGTYKSKSVNIAKTTSTTLPTDGLYSPLPTAGAPPYKVNQDDATKPNFYFYYVDEVTANDNQVYYYYSSAVSAKIGFPIIDDFTRSVTGGLGTMTPSLDSYMSPTSYIYNVPINASSWSVNGSVAVNASSVTGTDPNTYPQQSVELGGKTDQTIAVSLPGGADGLGLVFWSTGAGSWWASRINRTSATATKNVYYTTSPNCDTEGTQANSCRSAIENRDVCTANAGTYANHCAVITTCPENSSGGQVTHCATRIVPTCPNNGTGSLGTNCKSRIVQICPDNDLGSTSSNCKTRSGYTCPENGTGTSVVNCGLRTVATCTNNGSGSSTTNCKSRIVATCPDNDTGSSSSNCKSRTVYSCPANGTGNNIVNCGVTVTNTCPANGTGSSGTNCNTRTVNTCPANGTGTAGSNCGSRTVSVSSCPNNALGSTSSNCRSRTVYSCPSGQTVAGAYCYSSSFPYALIGNATSTIVYDNYVYTDTTVYDQGGTATVYDKTVSSTRYDSTVSGTTYDKTVNTTVYDKAGTTTAYDSQQSTTFYDNYADTTVYDSSVDSTVYDLAVDTYSGNVATPTTIYYTYGCTVGPNVQYDGTVPTNCLNTVSSVTVYNTKLNILNANGNSVSIKDTTDVYQNEEIPSPVGGISVTTSSDTIYTTVYSDTARNTLLRSVSYIAINPTKSDASGRTYSGMIKTPAGISAGVWFDDLTIS